ncbi:hypothetical protein M5V91_10440 [Cytobacillus pseudoceanisediminis]|uniref:hypothetical protein n=1 Tax=Cytobacillus pseudoceanisediminis TaxID=3051614 RepID=UPI002188A8C5|nr:hypothetical protein [Cytobacillus pseudoceanisediminis]UQX56003.1 hypothetical protein M5V91_10440 [Cytobacillus pseudoceanisediminis]
MENSVIQVPEAYSRILQDSDVLGFGQSCDRKTGFLLKGLAASKPGGSFLELGTGTGASASWIIDGMDESSKLTTVDIDSTVQSIAKKTSGMTAELHFAVRTEQLLFKTCRKGSILFLQIRGQGNSSFWTKPWII